MNGASGTKQPIAGRPSEGNMGLPVSPDPAPSIYQGPTLLDLTKHSVIQIEYRGVMIF